MTRHRRRRELTDEEIDLWLHVTSSVVSRPGALRPARTPPPAPAAAPPPPEAKARRYEAAGYTPPVAAPKPKQPPLAPIERRLRQKLARGQRPIDAAIDLHGMRQEQAYHALHAFLLTAQAQGAGVVLVVTGKGAGDGFDGGTGVLRRVVPHWLHAADWRPLVIGYEDAGRPHGGGGALYVRVRKRERMRPT